MIVGITQRIDFISGRNELRDALDQRLASWLIQAGYLPVPIPNTLFDKDNAADLSLENWLSAVKPGALLLSGGNDIGEYPSRDDTERYLLSWAVSNGVPVLGICRGLQMLAVWAGVTLEKKEGHAGTRHPLRAAEKNEEWPGEVNSYHNWIVSVCPDEFKVTARSEDGAIEAIRHSELSLEGWMWHPERDRPFSQLDIKRIRCLFGQ
ncbi:MAG: C26 family cysteine hydrolase domain-containing family [Chlorobiaceae bacterium]|nr:C26 family cysteine hydrolase domain-containing family [Chlorobiaceae bacterium]